VVALAVMPPLILISFLSALVGVIASRIALAKIRKNPNQYSGRGWRAPVLSLASYWWRFS
jgi:hypothetical protein